MEPNKPTISFTSTDRVSGFVRQYHEVQKDTGLDPYDVPLSKRKSFSKRVATAVDKTKLTVEQIRQKNLDKNN